MDPLGLDWSLVCGKLWDYPNERWVPGCRFVWVPDANASNPTGPPGGVTPGGGGTKAPDKDSQLRKDFRDFVDHNGCTSILQDKEWARVLKRDINAVQFRDVNAIQDKEVTKFFGRAQGAVPGMSVGTFFDAYSPGARGALTMPRARSVDGVFYGGRAGIYTRGGSASFGGGEVGMYLLLHEMLHYTTGKGDQELLNTLGVTKREGESATQALSRYINSGCDLKQK